MSHLHPNHHLVILATHNYLISHDMKILLKDSPESLKTYQKILERGKMCIQLYNVIGTSEKRATLEATLSMAIIRYNFKSHDYVSIEKDDYSEAEKGDLLQEIVTHLHNACKLTVRFPPTKTNRPVLRNLKHRYFIWHNHLRKFKPVHEVQSSDSEPEEYKMVNLRKSEGSTLINFSGQTLSSESQYVDSLTSKQLSLLPLKSKTNDDSPKWKEIRRRMVTNNPRKIINVDDNNVSIWKGNEGRMDKVRIAPPNNFTDEKGKSKEQSISVTEKDMKDEPQSVHRRE